MTQLETTCPDCGRPTQAEALCGACEQDRAMQLAQADGRSATAIYGEA